MLQRINYYESNEQIGSQTTETEDGDFLFKMTEKSKELAEAIVNMVERKVQMSDIFRR